MSNTKLPSSRRYAIWKVHDKKCAYCSEPISFANLEIDHILPERLLKTPSELQKILTNYGLPFDFNLNDFINLLPSHKNCNARKTGLLFKRNAAMYFLELAAAKANRAYAEEQAALKQFKQERVLASLQIALEAGELSWSQVTAILNRIDSGVDAFEVIHQIEFSNRIIKGLLSEKDIETLLVEPILPRKHGLEHLTMEKKIDGCFNSLLVTTCKQWAEAVENGYYAKTNYDIKEEFFFQRAYALVQALLVAQVPERSYISRPIRGIVDLDLLPVTLLPHLGSDWEELVAMDKVGLTFDDLAKDDRLIIEHRSPHYLSVVFDEMGKAYWEILRADLNHDGTEDILLSTYSYTIGGTFGAGGIEIISMASTDSKFEILSHEHLLP